MGHPMLCRRWVVCSVTQWRDAPQGLFLCALSYTSGAKCVRREEERNGARARRAAAK